MTRADAPYYEGQVVLTRRGKQGCVAEVDTADRRVRVVFSGRHPYGLWLRFGQVASAAVQPPAWAQDTRKHH